MITDIYAQGKPLKKAEPYHRDTPGDVHNTATVVDKTRHGQKRRILGHGFSQKSLQALEPSITEQVRIFCQRLEEKEEIFDVSSSPTTAEWTNPKNMAKWCMISPIPNKVHFDFTLST